MISFQCIGFCALRRFFCFFIPFEPLFQVLPEDAGRWRNASLKFRLSDGGTRISKPAAILTARQLRRVRQFFGLL